jgi:hypothetical protein
LSDASGIFQSIAFSSREYLRPWKLSTFAIGLSLLIAGSFYYQTPDWDIGISIGREVGHVPCSLPNAGSGVAIAELKLMKAGANRIGLPKARQFVLAYLLARQETVANQSQTGR